MLPLFFNSNYEAGQEKEKREKGNETKTKEPDIPMVSGAQMIYSGALNKLHSMQGNWDNPEILKKRPLPGYSIFHVRELESILTRVRDNKISLVDIDRWLVLMKPLLKTTAYLRWDYDFLYGSMELLLKCQAENTLTREVLITMLEKIPKHIDDYFHLGPPPMELVGNKIKLAKVKSLKKKK